MLSEPVNELFYEGRGRRRELSTSQPMIQAPFPSRRPIRFRGQVRYYVDTSSMPKPASVRLPQVIAQILFTPYGANATTRQMYYHVDNSPRYLQPGLPLLVSFSPDFSFTLTENGRLRFSLYLQEHSAQDLRALYEDTVRVMPDNDI
jgi:hypothetical protein